MSIGSSPIIYRQRIPPTPITEHGAVGVINGNIFTAKYINPWAEEGDESVNVAITFPNYTGPTGMKAELREDDGVPYLIVYQEVAEQVMEVAIRV